MSGQPRKSAIQGYAVIFEELHWPGNLRSHETKVEEFLSTTSARLGRLKKYSWYRIQIAGMNRRGIGVPSEPLVVLTDEDGECNETITK